MNGAVDVRVLARLVLHEAVDHRLRHLARSRVVEKDERVTVHLQLEDREIGAYALDVEALAVGARRYHAVIDSRFSRRPGLRHDGGSSRATTDRTGMRSMTAAPKA